MNDKASFTLRGRNPDVLTCIANLSNDEVFTPPEFANRMLDTVAEAWAANNGGANIWADSTVRFLDPFTKSGVFLREITRRLNDGLESEFQDRQKRVDHILSKQVFGIAITQLTSLLARRSLYCSKHANGPHSIAKEFADDAGNIWFERMEHTWVDGRCRFCGASQKTLDRGEGLETHAYAFIHTDDIKARVGELFGGDMQFDVIIGNPPYQLDDGGFRASATPIYQHFVQQAKALQPRLLTMIIPARWYSGGRGLESFRDETLADTRIRVIHDFLNAGDAFPGIGIQGGILYFLWDKEHEGDATITSNYEGRVLSVATRPLLEDGADVFIRHNQAIPILKKVIAAESGSQANSVALPEGTRFSDLVSSGKPFGLRTYVRGHEKKSAGDVRVYQNGGEAWIPRTEVPEGLDLIDTWKVFVGAAYGGADHKGREPLPLQVIGKPTVGEPGSVATETYIAIGPFASEREAQNAASYLSTRFARFLVLLHKPSQHASKRVYTFVPRQDFSKPWSDEELYAKYGITQDEIEFIEFLVRAGDAS